MLVLPYWSISFLVLPHFLYTQARKWDVQVCVTQEYSHPVHIALNSDTNASITCLNKENCFSTEFELVNTTQPRYIFIRPPLAFKVIVQSHDLQEGYGALCQRHCYRLHLTKWTHWSIEVKLNKTYGNDEYSFEIKPFVKTNVVFRPNNKTSNKSFFLPMEMNERSRIKLLTKGKFWLDTDIKLKNMETSEIYSCIYLDNQFTQTSYHECSSANSTQVTLWDIEICSFMMSTRYLKRMYLNRKRLQLIIQPKKEFCYKSEVELDNGDKPKTDRSLIRLQSLKVIVQSHDLQEGYGALCQRHCYRLHLTKWTHWSIEVKLNKTYGNDEYSFEIEPFVKTNVVFRPNNKTSNKSFFLPMEMNERSRIKLLTKGKFWLDTDIKLKNMETSEIYSCIYLHDQFIQTSYHECSSANASVWKIELTSRPRLIRNITEIDVFLGVPGSETDSLHNLTLRKLAYLPTFADFTNIGNIRTSEADIHFNDTNKAFDIFKIVVTRVLTGEEYGCANLHKTIPAKYSCRLLQSKNWQLRIISPEEHEQTFFVEIIQDTLSFFSRGLIWRNLCKHGFDCVDNFNLKTYEDNEITGLKLHFLDKPLRINDISLRNDYSEYKFKATKESKIEYHAVTEFIPITKEKFHPDKTVHNMKIVIGLFVVIILLLIIIIVILCNRFKMLRKSLNKGYISTPQDTGRCKVYIPMQDANITRPSTELGSQLQNPEDIYANTDPMSGGSAAVRDSAVYEDLH